MSRLVAPSIPVFAHRFGISAKHGAERTRQEPWGTHFKAVLGPAQLKLRTPEAMLHFSEGQTAD
eukprot:15483386-Alexandrium_andersonii.AAC.1